MRWQASVSEQVPAEALPSAVALNGISYNIARSFEPAMGGVIVASAGAVAAFITNALLYLPLLIVLFFWRRLKEPSRLTPERVARTVISGVRYIVHSPPIRIVLGRRVCRPCRDKPLASAIRERARLRGSRLDGFGHAVQRWCPARRPALCRRCVMAAYQAAITVGIALGSWMWGSIANGIGVERALLISGAALVASPLLGSLDVLADPQVRLSLTPRSGPIEIEIEYPVDPAKVRLFYAVMQHVQLSRQRNGAYGWSIARDIADPQLWTEPYHCPTWHDYLRQRSRSTERALHLRANEFHIGPEPNRMRRMLERPIGSVRWKEDAPDRSTGDVAPIASPGNGP
jgi:hypothetical protein